MPGRRSSRILALAALFGAFAPAMARGDLKPDELVLVVNGNSPQSVKMAEHYAKMRSVPDGRICKLDLPATEEIPFEVYERNVVPTVRAFLRDNKLQARVRCLVTFYGTPIRIAGPKIGESEQRELASLRTQLSGALGGISAEVGSLEKFITEHSPDFVPKEGGSLEQLVLRFEHAGRRLGPMLAAAPVEKRAELFGRIRESFGVLLGDVGLLERFAPTELANPATPLDRRAYWIGLTKTLNDVKTALQEANERRYEPAERARARDLAQQHCGLIYYANLVNGHIEYFGDQEAQAAFDSELAMLWRDFYPRSRWLINPLHYSVINYAGAPVLMTARLDGPDESYPGLLLLGSLKAEREGLTGKFVIDSRGLKLSPDPSKNGYASYDEGLRRLAEMVRTHTKMSLVFDENEKVLPANSVREVAVYAGWYSVNNYVPSMRFKPGAVGYHIASLEMVSLKDSRNNGWVRGLLKDGIASTVGAVSEPYLHSFPDADEFFPLVLTGKLTMAECYWKTQKLTSWQSSFVGDPLYRPFDKNPQLAMENLPPRLLRAFASPGAASTRPAATLPAGSPPTSQAAPSTSR